MSRGFSLLEGLVATWLGSLFLLAAFYGFQTLQSSLLDVQTLSLQHRQTITAASLLSSWLVHAGAGVDPEQAIATQSGVISALADIDGPDGMPDGSLDDSYEDLDVRSNGSDLQIRTGSGSFQPALKDVVHLSADLNAALVTLDIKTLDHRRDRQSEAVALGRSDSFSLHLVHLRSPLFER